MAFEPQGKAWRGLYHPTEIFSLTNTANLLLPGQHPRMSVGSTAPCMSMSIIPVKLLPCSAARVLDRAMNSSSSMACRRLRRHINTCSCFPGSCFSTSCGP